MTITYILKDSTRYQPLSYMFFTANIYRTGDVILAAIHYLRSVEKEDNTPPREVKRLIEDSGRWTDEELEKWSRRRNKIFPLCIDG